MLAMCPDECNCAWDKCMAGHLDSRPTFIRIPMEDKERARITALELQVEELTRLVMRIASYTLPTGDDESEKTKQDPHQA